MDETAASVYGFQSYTPAYPGGLAVAGPQGSYPNASMPAEVAPSLGWGHTNPLFWVLIIVLIVTGYIAGGFDVGVKKIGNVKARIG